MYNNILKQNCCAVLLSLLVAILLIGCAHKQSDAALKAGQEWSIVDFRISYENRASPTLEGVVKLEGVGTRHAENFFDGKKITYSFY